MKYFKTFKAFRRLVKERVEIELEKVDLFDDAKEKIEGFLQCYPVVKIGKTSDFKNRFDKAYKDQGFEGIKLICSSKWKKVIDELEEDLITHFKGQVENLQIGGGNKSYSTQYCIYIVYKTKV